MSARSRFSTAAVLGGLLVSAVGISAAQSDSQGTIPKPLYTAATVERAKALLSKMTPEEKIGQMTQLFVFRQTPEVDKRASEGGMGSALFMTNPVEINRLQHLAVENTRLHIPLIFGFDVIHGFRTIFPVPLAMAASWDPEMVEQSETVAAAEASSVGINWAFAPMIDIARDPRWGRMVEGAGEDPFLGSAMAAAHVRGFQGPVLGTSDHLLACAKHFAGYGAAEGGRDYDASYISETQLQNVYLPPFHAAVDAGVGSLMSAYMDLNDVPASGNRFLLTETLRDQWKFQGFVVSDADAVKSLVKHGFATSEQDAAVRAVDAGINMEMAGLDTEHPAAFDTLKPSMDVGKMTAAQLDAAVLPILETKIQLGLFEHPYVNVPRSQTMLNDRAHRIASQHAAEKSAVLLRNEGTLLPLSKTAYKTIAVIGPTGSDPLDMTGPWTFQQKNDETVTIPQGLKRELGAGVTVEQADGVEIRRHFQSFFDQIQQIKRSAPWSEDRAHAEFDKAVALAKRSDLVLLTMGEHQQMSGEAASDSSLELPGDQQKLMEAIVALGKPTVLLLMNGRPLDIRWAAAHIPAILEIWHPGSEGGTATANLLFGDAIPGGHLPFTWPRDVGQIPINYSHNLTQDASKQGERYWSDQSTPLYPFGYGLSYSTFRYSGLKLASASPIGTSLAVQVDVENTGNTAADDVAQLYVHQRSGRSSRPVRELKGFERIHFGPGEHRTLTLTVEPADLAYWSAADGRRAEDAATYDIWIGSDSTAGLHGSFERTSR